MSQEIIQSHTHDFSKPEPAWMKFVLPKWNFKQARPNTARPRKHTSPPSPARAAALEQLIQHYDDVSNRISVSPNKVREAEAALFQQKTKRSSEVEPSRVKMSVSFLTE
jgi:hypothetical protein